MFGKCVCACVCACVPVEGVVQIKVTFPYKITPRPSFRPGSLTRIKNEILTIYLNKYPDIVCEFDATLCLKIPFIYNYPPPPPGPCPTHVAWLTQQNMNSYIYIIHVKC